MKNPFLWHRIALSLCVVALLTLGVEYAKMRAEVFAGAKIYRAQAQELSAARKRLEATQKEMLEAQNRFAAAESAYLSGPITLPPGKAYHFYVAGDLVHDETEEEQQRQAEANRRTAERLESSWRYLK